MLQRWLKKTKEEEPVIPTKFQDSTPIPTISNEQPTKKTKTEWTELSLQHILKYKWVSKREDGLVICKFCTTFPKISKPSENFVKGWSGTANGCKFEAFLRHEQKNSHNDCKVEWEKSNGAATNKTAPEVSTWVAKLSDTFRDELCTKVIVEKWLSTEHVAADKYGSLLEAFEQAKANVGSTYRNRYGFDIVNAVHSDQILADQKVKFQDLRFFPIECGPWHR